MSFGKLINASMKNMTIEEEDMNSQIESRGQSVVSLNMPTPPRKQSIRDMSNGDSDTFRPGFPSIRRVSIAAGLGSSSLLGGALGRLGAKRQSFASVGRRVSRALSMRKIIAPSVERQDVTEMERIHEMPRDPRFCATLSPEAQYATLKGYEDVLRRYLGEHYPDYAALLLRNATPTNSVEIRSAASRQLSIVGETVQSDEDVTDQATALQRGSTKQVDPLDIWEREPSIAEIDPRRNKTKSPPANAIKIHNSNPKMKPLPKREPLLPVVVPRQRQLVLTYRFQSGMDILDTVRQTAGENAISPRLKRLNRPVRPLKDYNDWSCVWNDEFQSTPAKT